MALANILSIPRPAVASYVSLAFGRYVVEPFFTPCAAPMVLIKLVSILGVSECNSSVCGTPPVQNNMSFTSCLSLCRCSFCCSSQLLEREHGLSHSGHFDFH